MFALVLCTAGGNLVWFVFVIEFSDKTILPNAQVIYLESLP